MLLVSYCNSPAAASSHHPAPKADTRWNNLPDTVKQPKRIYTTVRTTIPPVIDGKLDDSCWKLGEWQSNYPQYTPVYGARATKKTDLKILYDDKNIYVAIRAYDDMKKITRRLGRRDNFLGDLVGVQFDSYFDHRTAFEFDVTSAGQQIDLWVTNDDWDINWNAVWYSKVAYEDSAWTVEFEIPLSQLRYSSSPDQVWGLNSWRLIDRLQEEDHWNPMANDGTGQVYTFGEMHGLEGLKKNKRIEITPYVYGKVVTDSVMPGNPFIKSPGFKAQAGLDAKIGITNNFTLDATINPDFGQVEADPSEMNLTAFETYFEEKRPFFTEGKNIFNFTFDGDQLFYSRRIGHAPSYVPASDTVSMPQYTPIAGAFKLSGKTAKGLSVGIIDAITPNEYADVRDHNHNFKQMVEPFTNYFVGRIQQDFNQGNTIIGGIVTQTHRAIRNDYLQFLPKDATTFGFNITKYWDDRKYFFQVQAIGSNITGNTAAITRLQTSSARYYQRPDIGGAYLDTARTALNGTGASFKIGKWSKGHWRYDEEYIMRSPGLEFNDLGYMNISNVMKNNTNISYVEKRNTPIFKTYTLALLQQNGWNSYGKGLYSLASLTAQSEFMNGWTAQLSAQYKFRVTDEQLLRGGPAMKTPDLFSYTWMLQTNISKKFFVNFTGNYNRGVSGNLNYFNIATEFTFRPRSNVTVSMQPTFQQNIDELQYISEFDRPGANKTFLLGRVNNQDLGVSFRIDFALTPGFTIQYYGSPFVSIGKYSNFKEVINPLGPVYTNRFKYVQPQKDGPAYNFDDDGNGIVDYRLTNPDFNFQQFNSNLVLRWEYRAGSTIYLVWNQTRTGFQQAGAFDFNNGYKNMFNLFPQNVFMVKFSYWF